MDKFEKYLPIIKRFHQDYKFSWQISTDIIESEEAKKPVWLDIGARNNNRLKVHSKAALGVGIDIEIEKPLYTNDHNVYCLASVYNLPFGKNAFDFITSRFVFEHLESPETALKQISQILKPDGIFLLETTNKYNPLLIISSMIPFAIKKRLFVRLFKENPSGTYKTFYKINTPDSFRKLDWAKVDLKLEEFYLVNDVLCESKLLFFISFSLYKLLKIFRLNNLFGNLIAVIRKI